MKILSLFIFLLPFTTYLKAQNVDSQMTDSMLAIPQTLNLKISSPQPRQKEKVEISLDINYVKAQIFKTEFRKFEVAQDIGNSNENLLIMKVNPLIKGKQSMGPLSFIMNGTKYTTNKIDYEVIEALPKVDKGLWFRKIMTSDTSFCIIIEQRIPANSKVTKISENETKYWTEPTNDNIVRFKNSYSVDGLEGGDSESNSDFGYIIDEKKERKDYMSGYSITYFRIKEKQKKILITKDLFTNIPADFKFQDIIVQ